MNEEIKMLIGALISAIIVLFLFSLIGWFVFTLKMIIIFTVANYIGSKLEKYNNNNKI